MPTKGSGTRVPRNPVALSPLLRKGGVHEKSKTAKRQQTRQALSEQLDNWREELEFERELRSDSDLIISVILDFLKSPSILTKHSPLLSIH